MSGNIKAIETIYRGWKFRSRLEARWAVFMDELGVEYRYEPEGFDLDGIRYLPDFYLPKLKCWLEIKPDAPTNDEREKAIRLCLAKDEPVVIFAGESWSDIVGYQFTSWPDETKDSLTEKVMSNKKAVHHWITPTECITYSTHNKPLGWMTFFDIHRGYAWSLAQWHECTQCHDITLFAVAAVPCRCETAKYGDHETPRLVAAYTAARQARFEFGR
jgi:hypothetical protein